MNDKQLETLMAHVFYKLDEGPGSHLDALRIISQKHVDMQDLEKVICQIGDSLQFLRLVLKYVDFDLEATRRERDQLRMIVEDQDQ